MMKLKKNLPKILPNFSSCLEPAHPSVKIWSPFALVSVSVLPKSFGLSCFLDIFPGKVVQPGLPIIYPWDVSRSCARRLCPQTNYSNTAKHATIQNISWLKKTPEVKEGHLNIPWYNTVVWQQVFSLSLSWKSHRQASRTLHGWVADGWENKPQRNMQLGQMCASLSSCQKEEFQFCDWLINTNTKNNLKKFSPRTKHST